MTNRIKTPIFAPDKTWPMSNYDRHIYDLRTLRAQERQADALENLLNLKSADVETVAIAMCGSINNHCPAQFAWDHAPDKAALGDPISKEEFRIMAKAAIEAMK